MMRGGASRLILRSPNPTRIVTQEKKNLLLEYHRTTLSPVAQTYSLDNQEIGLRRRILMLQGPPKRFIENQLTRDFEWLEHLAMMSLYSRQKRILNKKKPLRWKILDQKFNAYQLQNFDQYFEYGIQSIIEAMKCNESLLEAFSDESFAKSFYEYFQENSLENEIKILYCIHENMEFYDANGEKLKFSWKFDFPYCIEELRKIRMGIPIAHSIYAVVYCVFLEKRSVAVEWKEENPKFDIQRLISFPDEDCPEKYTWELCHSYWIFENSNVNWKLKEILLAETLNVNRE
jgi:hypothetical protein